MNDTETYTKEEIEKAVSETLKELRPKSWPLAKFAWYSFLVLIGTACVTGTAWMVMAFVERWL